MARSLLILMVTAVLLLGAGPAQAAKKKKTLSASPKGQGGSEYLFPKDIQRLKKEKCAFFHVWATWCTICMEEMPDLIKVLKGIKAVRPVIIDVSTTSVQDSFSKRWMQQLRPGFTTYLKPDMKDEVYLDAIDKKFSGTLPYSAVFQKGKLLKSWTGQLDLKILNAEFQSLCAN
jgi:thiol-disulfide isomerase/thioredoxin